MSEKIIEIKIGKRTQKMKLVGCTLTAIDGDDNAPVSQPSRSASIIAVDRRGRVVRYEPEQPNRKNTQGENAQ